MALQTVPSMAPSSMHPFQHSPWHSPVPYLFGGLAAMLGLIAFALLILACSYWKLSGDMHNEGERDIEAGDSKPDKHKKDLAPIFEDKYLVIMAGQVTPTFLATAVTSSFGRSDNTSSTDTSVEEKMENEKQETSTGNHENTNQVP